MGGQSMIRSKNIAVSIILSIVTCGIYGIVWFININDDVNTVSGNQNATSGGIAFLLTLITCNIYGLYWMYQMGSRLDDAAAQRGLLTQNRGIIYLLLSFFGLSIVSYALMQDQLNKYADNGQS